MDRWDGGSDYDVFMGRWSRLVAHEFVTALGADEGGRWLDVGCGTGALLEAISDLAAPARLVGIDPSKEYVDRAASQVGDVAEVDVADGEHLPFGDDSFDIVVSGLALNFIPNPGAAVGEWLRVTRPGGIVSSYVWDYAEGMGFLRHFWDVAAAVDPDARLLDEGVRFPLCRPDRLKDLFATSGLTSVEADSIEIPTVFDDFGDYWTPFLRGQGPAPSYVASLTDSERSRLAENLQAKLPRDAAGQIALRARAWTITGNPRHST